MASSSPPDLATLLATIQTYVANFTSNVSRTFSNLSLRDYIRIVWIVGGYLFLRPYIEIGFRKLFQLGNKEETETETADGKGQGQGQLQTQTGRPRVSANALRDGIEQELEQEQQPEDEDVPQWGKSARRRQKKFMEFAENQEEDDDDKDIEDLLEDD